MTQPQQQPQPLWFSHYFGIEEPQYHLPFIDFNLNADVPIYIDPYAITKDRSDLAAHCHNAITSYFQTLLEAVRRGDKDAIHRLIHDRFVEPREIHLGVGRSARVGVGLGPVQENQVVEALNGSEALRSGVIQAVQELELHIEGIGPDKVSDLVANIIKGYLAEYTEQVCQEYGIETRPCAVNAFWNIERSEWDADYFNLPVKDTDSYILVPRRFVRRNRDLIDHRYFYEKYVLEVLQRETLSANDSLVQTLKTGMRRVTKKALREDPRFPPTKQFISRFIQQNPQTMDEYRKELLTRFRPADPAFLSGKAAEDDPAIHNHLQRLEHIAAGRANASEYHTTVYELLKFIFDWCLQNFEKEYKMDEGRGRIDIIADNYAGGGVFEEWKYMLNATSIPIECKNYAADLGNNEFNQINDRLGITTSRLGFIFCRTITDAQMMRRHVTDRWTRHGNCILIFDDDRLKTLTRMRLQRAFATIEELLREMFRVAQYNP